jgi:hypothetical protein
MTRKKIPKCVEYIVRCLSVIALEGGFLALTALAVASALPGVLRA